MLRWITSKLDHTVLRDDLLIRVTLWHTILSLFMIGVIFKNYFELDILFYFIGYGQSTTKH